MKRKTEIYEKLHNHIIDAIESHVSKHGHSDATFYGVVDAMHACIDGILFSTLFMEGFELKVAIKTLGDINWSDRRDELKSTILGAKVN